jgi:hypothetical protein
LFLAGEESADQHDFFDEDGKVTQNSGKQVDPVNFSRLVDTTDPLQRPQLALHACVPAVARGDAAAGRASRVGRS